MDRMHLTYQLLSRDIINDSESETNLSFAYTRHALLRGVYNPRLYAEAVVLGKMLKNGGQISTAVNRMSQWPIVYGLIVCKQVPTKKLAKIIEDKTFRPLAEELMTAIFGV